MRPMAKGIAQFAKLDYNIETTDASRTGAGKKFKIFKPYKYAVADTSEDGTGAGEGEITKSELRRIPF